MSHLIVVPKLQQPTLLTMAYYLPAKRSKQKIPCLVCKNIPCYEHCNNCGKCIYFKKNEWERWVCMEAGTELYHRCMQRGTRTGQYLDVNNKQGNVGNFWQDNVIQESDTAMVKQEKIKRFLRRTGGSYVESLKEEKNLWLAEKWRDQSFEY